ncbi:RkpR, polysaccharide export protein [Agrobacterium larrymoorei]|uniref:RkpR, polysaccharide export protein n=1 Tax=Agrobacterium larrymoorei TaxID=160699 RepID=A0ABX8T5Y0_9HYPH|nr:RkpR, polysaccharide export protein [Agrobacterium larrymoorei]QYA08669.1 RkpR, polysaccharide export protein [Agrobacterium larrymoorei]
MSADQQGPDQKADNTAVATRQKSLAVLDNLLKLDVKPVRDSPSKGPQVQRKRRGFKLRHMLIAAGFGLIVVVPTAATGVYMAFIAADQYHSSSAFAVRSIEGHTGGDILGMFTQSAGGSTTAADSYMLLDYIRSERMMEAVAATVDLEKAFARRGADFFYAMAQGLPLEDRLDHWKRVVTINYDHTSSILNLQVKAFEASVAQEIVTAIVEESERLINDLSLEARNGVLRVSQEEVTLAEGRLSTARVALRNFRDVTQEADPVEAAKIASQLVGSLEQQLTQLKTELSTAQSRMSPNSPRIRVIKTQIFSLEKQLEEEKQRFGSGATNNMHNSDVASRILDFEKLETEREFAEKAYTAALGGLEKARVDANNQQRYLATFIQPTRSELAQYPTRKINVALVFLACFFAWGVAAMGYYNIRDRN